MGNEYNRFNHHHHHHHYTHHHHHHHHAHLHINPTATFLPILCSRPSIKDVQVPSNTSFFTNSASPRISCVGQVKRSNKVSGFPITSQTNHSSNNNIKYSKLKKLFSGKNLVAATPTKTTAAAPAPTATSCPSRISRRPPVSNVKQRHCVTTTAINLVELDPPLPVIKRVPKPPQQGEDGSLWKRRSGGAALKGLQLKQVNLPRHQPQSTSV